MPVVALVTNKLNTKKLYLLPTQWYICMFLWTSEQTTCSLYNIECLIIMTDTAVCFHRGTNWIFHSSAQIRLEKVNTHALVPLCVFFK
jgi:hypothetical protein